MHDIPECLSRRYEALDELIQELSSYKPDNINVECPSTNDPGIKLMCDFWDILKEDPDINLKQAVQQRMNINGVSSGFLGPSHVSCYMAGCCNNEDRKREALKKMNQINNDSSQNKSDCSTSKLATPSSQNENLPLNKVLCNLKEAASFEKKCHGKINDLLESQKQLQQQIQILEEREKDGMQLLKQADCMWSCMEESYKKKIAESLERQKGLLNKLKDVEKNNAKWRKDKKDLEFQMNNINKCYQEILEKINEKTSDVKCIDMEIDNFKKRIESNKKDLEVAKKSHGTKKQASNAKINSIAAEVIKLEKILKEEQKYKLSKEQEGRNYIIEAREDLQKLCKVLLQKKLENEDMKAEKDALLLEIELLIQSSDQCKDKCKNNQESMIEEIKAIDKEVADFKVRCTRCHVCTDTIDIRRFCTDCPRCLEERNCLYEGEYCSHDPTTDCVCVTVKKKFLDNVFDNMYTILERQVQSKPGKAVAQEVMECLKKSRNGKLNQETRKILQDFILSTVKRNLILTIVGGAVKTRCEMDPETYKQLMLCLKQVKVTKPTKTDKGTDSKKEPCRRWGGSSECNCPKGPRACVCTQRAPAPPGDPSPCPPESVDKEDAGQVIACPHKESTPCGPDCGMHGVKSSVGSEVASWRPSPCQGPTCQFKNMRAAQCVLGPEALSSLTGPISFNKPCATHVQAPYASYAPASYPSAPNEPAIQVPARHTPASKELAYASDSYIISPLPPVLLANKSPLQEQVPCRCGAVPSVPCVCSKDSKQMKAELGRPCDKETCTATWQSVINEINIDNVKKTNGKDRRVKKTYVNLDKNQPNIFTHSNKNQLDNACLTDARTITGDLKMKSDPKNVNVFEQEMQINKDLHIGLKDINSGELSVSSHANENEYFATKKVLVRKSPSGNLFYEVKRKGNKKCFLNLPKSIDKVRHYSTTKESSRIKNDASCGERCGNKEDLSYESFSKFILDTTNKINSECKTRKTDKTCNQISKVTVKGVDHTANELFFAIKPIMSGTFEIILDKEFEKWYRQAIKEYTGKDENQYAHFEKSESGNYIINFNMDDLSIMDNKNAILIRSESGNIKVVVNENTSESESTKTDTECAIAPRTVSHLLGTMPRSSREFHKERLKKSRTLSTKSNSDSNVYEKVKFDLQNNQNLIESEAVLKKTNSGQYTVVLDKESKKAFINNLKNYLSSSSKGLVPVKRTESGIISVNLNSDHRNQNASLKITPSGNMYVVLDKNTVKGISTETRDKNKDCQDKDFPQYKNVEKNTDINSRVNLCCSQGNESSCEEKKCVCKNKCYKTKEWFSKNSNKISIPKACGKSTLTSESSFTNFDSENNFEHKNSLPHIVIKPCGCRPALHRSSVENCYSAVQSFCPYHIDRYQTVSNEILEISGLCNRTDLEECEKIKKCPKQNKQIEGNWNSLKFLPPQLPSFLKDFNAYK